MSTMFWIWMAAAVVFLIIELVTPTLIFVCFVVGAACAGIYGQFSPEGYTGQVAIFLVVSLILLPFTRKLAAKITKPVPQASNVDRMIGQTALVIRAIDPDEGGQIRYEGEVWAAQADRRIEEQTKVIITAVTGTRVKVERQEESDSERT
ncbi:MAG: NfeD family protein [Candidatus Zixiibacteriota bacterium]|nr:MAG: NfeD family protein [candidate division Zixibacteria bacterium]